MTDFTTIIAVDGNTLEQLAVSLPTWRANRPEIFARPVIVAYDRDQFGRPELFALQTILGKNDWEFQFVQQCIG